VDAKAYLEQARDLHTTIVTMQARLRESRESLDMLRSAAGDGMPRGGSDGKALENAIVEYDAHVDEYARELARWAALRTQAYGMLDRARAVLADGGAHAITFAHIDVLEQHYLCDRLPYTSERYGERTVSTELRIPERTVERYAKEALEWLDWSRDLEGRPLVPLVSE